MADVRETVRIAAVGDLHCARTSQGVLATHFARIAEEADVLALCGDLTDYGLAEEAHVLVRELSGVKIPMIAVLGNHDLESDQGPEVSKILCEAGIRVLDGESVDIHGIGFAGTKGFGGGFGRRALEPWGEPVIKRFVREALDEAIKLEKALARLRVRQRVVLLHYSPIKATVEGEPPDIFPFLGSSRLEEPINRYECAAVFHGHAHRGTNEGRTTTGVPVYNVAMPLLRRHQPERPGYRILELAVRPPRPAVAEPPPPPP